MALEARRAELERQIRVASSRQVLVPLAERTLGLHQPSDSEFTLLPVRPRPRSGPDGQARRPHRRDPVRLRARRAWRCSRGRSSSRSSTGSKWAKEAESKRTERQVLDGPPGRALRPQRGPARHHPGVLPRRDRAQRAGRPRPRRCRAHRPQPRRPGSAARSRVPRAEAVDLPPRPLQRDPGPAAARHRGACTSRAPSSDSTPRASWPARSSAGSRPIAPSAAPGWSWRWTRFSPASRARRCC